MKIWDSVYTYNIVVESEIQIIDGDQKDITQSDSIKYLLFNRTIASITF